MNQENPVKMLESEEDSQSVLSYAKTADARTRYNPALMLQEFVSTMSSSVSCKEMFKSSIELAQTYSTESFDHHQASKVKVSILLEKLKDTVSAEMPVHACEALSTNQKDPGVLLVAGIVQAGKGNHSIAIEHFRHALRLYEAIKKSRPSDRDLSELRLNCLNQIGIVLCLTDKFDEAERYFQLALEEYTRDSNLLPHVLSKYQQLAVSLGIDFIENSPYEKLMKATAELNLSSDLKSENVEDKTKSECQGAAACLQAEVSTNKQSCGDAGNTVRWFPSTKEELLDYSAAYLQMMLLGAEMVKQHIQNQDLHHHDMHNHDSLSNETSV